MLESRACGFINREQSLGMGCAEKLCKAERGLCLGRRGCVLSREFGVGLQNRV